MFEPLHQRSEAEPSRRSAKPSRISQRYTYQVDEPTKVYTHGHQCQDQEKEKIHTWREK